MRSWAAVIFLGRPLLLLHFLQIVSNCRFIDPKTSGNFSVEVSFLRAKLCPFWNLVSSDFFGILKSTWDFPGHALTCLEASMQISLVLNRYYSSQICKNRSHKSHRHQPNGKQIMNIIHRVIPYLEYQTTNHAQWKWFVSFINCSGWFSETLLHAAGISHWVFTS